MVPLCCFEETLVCFPLERKLREMKNKQPWPVK